MAGVNGVGNRDTSRQEGLSRAGLTRPGCMVLGKQQRATTRGSGRSMHSKRHA